MQEGGHRVKAGQAVRLLDVRVQRRYGAWDYLHGHTSGNALSDALKRAAGQHYGHAGRAFLQRLTREQDSGFTDALDAIRELPAFAVDDGDGQVKRGAARFALLALAGELATGYGVTGWDSGAATEAAGILFNAWCRDRGSTGANLEQAQIRNAVLAFIESHGASRFQDVDKPEAIIHNRAGWRDASSGTVRYLFTTGGMREALKGFDFQRATTELIRCGAMPAPGADGKRAKPHNIHGEKKRLYEIDATKLEGDGHGNA